MNTKLLVLVLCCSWELLSTPTPAKIIHYMHEINEALIMVINHPQGTKKQVAALERAKVLVQEAIVAEGIMDNATLYAIGAILLDDPIYAARSVELQKADHTQRSSTQLAHKEKALEDQAEKYRFNIVDRIEDIEMILMSSSMTPDCRAELESKKSKLEKEKKWVEAQSMAHGMLKQALYKYKNLKEESSSSQ